VIIIALKRIKVNLTKMGQNSVKKRQMATILRLKEFKEHPQTLNLFSSIKVTMM
jgi:hypothetical protein